MRDLRNREYVNLSNVLGTQDQETFWIGGCRAEDK